MAGGDGCINGWSVNKGGRGCGGRGAGEGAAPPPQCEPSIDSMWDHTGLRRFGCLVCWLLGGLPMQSKYRQHLGETFGCLVCLLLVGYPPFLFNSPSFGCWLVQPA